MVGTLGTDVPEKRHVLLVGTSREVHIKMPLETTRLSLICTMRNLKSLGNMHLYERVISVPESATTEEWVAAARMIDELDPVGFLAGFNELTQIHAAHIAVALNLPGISPDVIDCTRNKALMRKRLAQQNVEVVPAAVVSSHAELQGFIAQNGLPVVVKPIDGRGSSNISIIRNDSDVHAARALPWPDGNVSGFIAEMFLDGPEYSVEGISEGGIHGLVCITQKFKDPVSSIETGHALPAPLTPDLRNEITSHVKRALTALGFQNGPSHTEVIFTPEGPRIVETHTRLAGDSVVELVKLGCGVDLDELWIRQILGESILDDAEAEFSRGAAVAFATPNAIGTVSEVRLDASPRSGSGGHGLIRTEALLKPDDKIQGIKDSYDRGAFAIAIGSNAEEAIAIARKAADGFVFVVECRNRDGDGTAAS